MKKIVAVLTLTAIVLAFVAPALAQTRGMPTASPTMMPPRVPMASPTMMPTAMPGGMQGGMMIPMEQSSKDMLAAMADSKDITMPTELMKKGGIEGMVTPEGRYTLFVASDDALLKSLSQDTLNKMMDKMSDRQMAAEFVRGHLVNDMVTPDMMTDGKTLTMMNGKTMKVTKTDGQMMIDDANIIKAIKANNGIIYVMDRIPSSIATMMRQMDVLPASAMPMSG